MRQCHAKILVQIGVDDSPETGELALVLDYLEDGDEDFKNAGLDLICMYVEAFVLGIQVQENVDKLIHDGLQELDNFS